MYYKTEKNPRSRLASLGSETLNNSLAGSALSQNDPYTPIQPRKISQPQSQYLSIPNYSAYRMRKTDPLKDFHMQIEERFRVRNHQNRNYKSSVTEPAQQPRLGPSLPLIPMGPTPRTEPYNSVPLQSELRPFQSELRNQSDLKNEVSQLKVMMSKLMDTKNRQLNDDELERKISRLLPRKQTQQHFYPPPQPQFIPIPIYPPPPPQYPQYPPPPQYQQNPPSVPQEPSKPSSKKKLSPLRRLRKICWSVAFPFLLKAYSKKLAGIRHEKFKEKLEQSLEQCTQTIRNWFLETTNKSMSIIIDKNDVSMDFREETDAMVCQQKINLLCEVLDSLTAGLLNNTKADHLAEMSEFLEMTCSNHSFSIDSFLTQKQISYLSFSEDHGYLSIAKPIQQSQILVFVFIKMIIYNLLLQPWKFDDQLKGGEIPLNLYLIASIIYHCSCELIERRINQKQKQKGGWKKGNMSGKYQCATFLYKDAKNNIEQFISGMVTRKGLFKVEKFNGGKAWRNTIERIEKVMQKIHKQVFVTHKETHKQLLQSQANS